MSERVVVLITDAVADAIKVAGGDWGRVRYKIDEVNEIVGAVGAAKGNDSMVDVSRECLRGHFLAQVGHHSEGWWYRAPEGLHEWHRWMLRVQGAVPIAAFSQHFPTWRAPSREGASVILTHDPQGPRPWAAWGVTAEHIFALESTVLRAPEADPAAGLTDDWPLDVLSGSKVTLVGVGSIGGAAAHALAMAGVGHLTLVDPDRLLWHNLTRHASTRKDVGRYKVDAVAAAITERWPGTRVSPRSLDVISDADQVRPLFDESDVILCATDGVSPRRVVSHLARLSAKPAVLACVLLDGAVGEVLRLRPWPGHGCLLCHRQMLVDEGVLDPEPAMDRPYGTGDRHRPMTAVGSDLQLVGQIAAKVAIATILERHGHHDQSIRGEHAIIGLRPSGDAREYGPPFDVPASGIQWNPAWPQLGGCPTCGTAPRPAVAINQNASMDVDTPLCPA